MLHEAQRLRKRPRFMELCQPGSPTSKYSYQPPLLLGHLYLQHRRQSIVSAGNHPSWNSEAVRRLPDEDGESGNHVSLWLALAADGSNVASKRKKENPA